MCQFPYGTSISPLSAWDFIPSTPSKIPKSSSSSTMVYGWTTGSLYNSIFKPPSLELHRQHWCCQLGPIIVALGMLQYMDSAISVSWEVVASAATFMRCLGMRGWCGRCTFKCIPLQTWVILRWATLRMSTRILQIFIQHLWPVTQYPGKWITHAMCCNNPC